MRSPLTAERLRELLHYDPATGFFTWRVANSNRAGVGTRAGTPNSYGYIGITIDRGYYKAHRLAVLYMTGEWPKAPEVDHENTVKSDNTWTNLREATRTQNAGNRHTYKSNTSGFKGVSYHALSRRWRANISIGGKPYHLGLFDTREEASAAYVQKAQELYGEFARTS